MKCQILFSGRKNKKNISIGRLLTFLPRVLSVEGNTSGYYEYSTYMVFIRPTIITLNFL